MANPRLDKTRPHGSIHPPLEDGSFFEQDGAMFGHDGRFISGPARVKGAVVKAAPAPKEDEKPEDDEAVDLVAWAKKEKNYAFFKVKAAMTEAFPTADVTNSKTIVAALVAASIVGEDEAIR
jgi:hypothetical protein